MLEKIQETAAFLKGKMHTSPETAIILGTGLGSLADEITEKYEIKYSDIPNFPISTVEGHSGKLIFGKLGNKDIMAMQGRFHYYEGYSMKEVTFPVRVMRELGIKTLFVSNASGGTNEAFEIGDLMGFSIPEGYALAIVDGTPTIISKSQELLAAGEAAIAEGWNADELMAGLWDYTFQTTFAEIDKWKPELTQILEDMGVEAGSLLGVALPDGVAEGLKNGTMSVEQAAAAIAAAAVVTQADVNKSIADNTSRGEETGEAVATGEDNAKGTVGDASTGLHDTVTGAFVPLPKSMV